MNIGNSPRETYFAPAGRDSAGQLQQKTQIVAAASFLQQTIDAMSDLVLILNGNRQVVSANRQMLQTLGCRLPDVLGKRPGELAGCRNAAAGPDGCGTAHECMTCGAVNAILKCRESDRTVTRECRISLEDPVGGALDLRVSATVVDITGERFTICVLKDISDEKRLAVMARLFFHDVMNTAGGIQGYTELLRERFPADSPEDQELRELSELANQLIDEIRAQRDLTYAESGELELELDAVDVRELLRHLQAAYAGHPVARGRQIVLDDVWPGEILTDRRLLSRVVGNMIKNALEAIPRGDVVTLSCVAQGNQVVCRVHNPGAIPADIQMQVFQRSFSTKAAQGRGIGTHSMKLLGERYLHGQVGFTSRDPEGTTFWIRLPKSGPPEAP
jgi:nitrogen fixation/metabolism regulation signal transduction histidine kinase